jgi:outer membrane protein assembly factor BamB
MKKIIVLVCVLCAFIANAQKTDKPDLVYNCGGSIELMKMTESGVLLVIGSQGLQGIKPGQENFHFNFKEYGKVKETELEFVPLSPYLIVNQGGIMSSKKTLIDYVSGKLLFATEDNGWKIINSFHVLLPQNKLFVSGNKKGKDAAAVVVALYDLNTGKEEYSVYLNNPKKVTVSSAIPVVSGKPLLFGNNLLVPTTKALISVNLGKGEIDWTIKVDDINRMIADPSGNEIYALEETQGGDTKIYKVAKDGKLLWKEHRKVKGVISRFEILPQGLAIVSDVMPKSNNLGNKLISGASESKIAFFNAETGEDLWEKAPKTKGYVQHFYIMDDGILFGIGSGGINKISFSGDPLFRKPLQTGENIHTMALTSKGLIYITDTDANIISLETGESIWNKPIKYKKATSVASTYDAQNHRYLISTGSEMVSIDENTGDIRTFSTFKFNEKEEPNYARARSGGILLTSSQNVMMLNFDGSPKFHEYYKSPGVSTVGKIALGTIGVLSMATSSAAAYQAGMNTNSLGQYTDYGRQMKAQQDFYAGIASASFAAMNKRFKATTATENSHFILTTLDSGVGLVKLNKDTGKLEKEILLKDKKPVYEVDEIEGYLYYKAKNDVIYAFTLH